ncbi:MAG: hypothetical protein NTZ09_16745, partial [Candidatus Hydrogenedentes bacterium]|nr:hypothetical protein [Candidatus Hydrogenedentota bacterium]
MRSRKASGVVFCSFLAVLAVLCAGTALGIPIGPITPIVAGPSVTNELRPTWTWTPSLVGTAPFRHQLDSEAGTWTETTDLSWAPDVDLSEGPHTLYVQEWQDTAWSLSGSWTITLDVTGPEPPVVAGPGVSPDRIVTWTWTSGGGGNGTYRYRLNIEPEYTESTDTSYTNVDPLANGTYTFEVLERDDAGNWSEPTSYNTDVEAAPEPPIVTGPSATTNLQPEWTWTSGGFGNGTFQYQLDGTGGTWTETTDTTYTPDAPLTEGPHALCVQESNEVGWSVEGCWTIEVDVTAPSKPVMDDASVAGRLVTWTWTSGGGGNGTYQYKLDDAAEWTEITDATFTNVDPLADGTHTLYVQERDEAGNWSESSEDSADVDASPNAPVVSGPTVTNNTQPQWTWESGGFGNGTFRYMMTGIVKAGWTETTDTSYTPETPLGEGIYTLYVQETDGVDWSSSGSWTIEIDLTSPSAPTVMGPAVAQQPWWYWTPNGGGNGTYRVDLDSTDKSVALETDDTHFPSRTHLYFNGAYNAETSFPFDGDFLTLEAWILPEAVDGTRPIMYLDLGNTRFAVVDGELAFGDAGPWEIMSNGADIPINT